MQLINVFCISYGASLLPFVNCTDFNELRVISRDIHYMCKKGAKYVTFYGMPVPKTPGLFNDLFYGKYTSLEQRIINNEDFRVSSIYNSVKKKTGPAIELSRGDTQIFIRWNGLVLMELAYLLSDKKAIELLESYNRNTCHQIMCFSATYDFISIRLTEKYSEYKIKKQLIDLRPPYAK